MTSFDAVVVGSGPNGLAAAVTLARAGLSVQVLEREDTPGGGARTVEATLPGFRHDSCSAVHPLALASEFFRAFALERRVEFVVPDISFGHPLADGRAAIAYRSLERTITELGRDGRAYGRLLGPLARRADAIAEFTGAPLVPVPRHLLTFARFGLASLEQGSALWNARFREDAASALLTGVMAHAILHLPSLATAGAGLSLAAYGHARGWPVPVGGSQAITDALVADLRAHGGEVVTGVEVTSLDELPRSRVVMLDVTPRALLSIAGSRVPDKYARAISRFRYGNGVAKVDFALSEPVPWRDDRLRRAGTVHVGGTRAEIARAENEVARGRHPDAPYVLVSQPTNFDPGRAPAGAHTLWTYTHVPAGSRVDRTETVVRQLERFAPVFATRSSLRRVRMPRPSRRATPTSSAVTSRRASRPSSNWPRARCSPPTRGAHPSPVSTSARRPPPRARGCTACAGGARPEVRSSTRSACAMLPPSRREQSAPRAASSPDRDALNAVVWKLTSTSRRRRVPAWHIADGGIPWNDPHSRCSCTRCATGSTTPPQPLPRSPRWA